MTDTQIIEQPAVFDERILDRWGNEFRFDHVKGLAEWIKNSVDADIREDIADDEQLVFIRFIVERGKTPAQIQCIDFVGMAKEAIENASKRWGDPEAAGRKRYRVYGGHGNGGKFYMRQMFGSSRFVTYRDGRLNIFGFSPNKKYGFARGFEDRKCSLSEAMKTARITSLNLPETILDKLKSGRTGFTVVIGEGLKRASRKNSPKSIVARLKVHPQARRLLARYPIYAIVNDEPTGSRLQPEPIPPRPGFEKPLEFPIPTKLLFAGEEIVMANADYPSGMPTIRSSTEPFSPHGDRSVLNCIDILGDMGCVASYRMHELGILTNAAQAEFLYGECYCPILESPDEDSIRNDREKLVDNERSRALINWIRECVNAVTDEMAEQVEREQKQLDLKRSSEFNDLLNKWKNRFMTRLYAEILRGPGEGAGAGGSGGGGSSGGGTGGEGGGGSRGDREDGGGGEGDERSRGTRFPMVLLSNWDTDPLHPEAGQRVNCDPRHPPVYQRDEDVEAGVFWINTVAPFAEKTIQRYGSESARWRDYMFHRYVDIIVKQAIYDAGKQQMEFTPSGVDDLLDRVTRRVYADAAESLYDFLFRDRLDAPPLSAPDAQAEGGGLSEPAMGRRYRPRRRPTIQINPVDIGL